MLPYEQVLDEEAADRGSSFSREPISQDDGRGYRAALWTTLASWVLAFLGPLSLLFPLVGVIVFLKLISERKLKAAGIVALGTPCTLFVLLGISDYARGTARLRGMGLPGTTFHNPDPVTRMGRSSGGCIVSGNEWVSIAPYNTTVTALGAVLGPMPGTYRGVYPTESEAKSAITQGTEVAPDELKSDQFDVGGATVRLDHGVGSQLLEKLRYEDFELWGEADPAILKDSEITATIFEADCVIVRIPVMRDWDAKTPSAAVVLIDRQKGRPFAYYAEGEYYHNFPPVPYHRQD